MTPDELPGRTATLLDRLRGLDSVVVAFSGGVDSGFVLAAALRALGPDRVLAATAVSPSLPAAELAAARELAVSLGATHLTPVTEELARSGYRANGRDRCYFCKSEVLDVLCEAAAERGFAAVATGTNADDAADGFRPGIRAADERGVLAPLRDAGFTKAEVRKVSREWGLPVWDKPAAPCLASRIAYGIEVTRERLARVEAAERATRRLLHTAAIQPRDLRVRDLGAQVRVEVDADLVAGAAAIPELSDTVRAAGFADAQVTVTAFRSGVLNHEPTRST
jgi:uncharacterized protein